MKKCSNCLKEIVESNFTVHEAFCARFMTKCEKCEEFFRKSEMKSHEEEEHIQIECKFCQKLVEKSGIKVHEEICLNKPVSCPICKVLYLKEDLEDHLEMC